MKKVLSVIMIAVLISCLMTGCMTKPNQVQQPQTGQSSNAPDTSEFIGEEKAKEIALERAGISSNGVVFDRVELDRDNGVWQYEVDFREGRTEYDADINATDGSILKWEVDYDD